MNFQVYTLSRNMETCDLSPPLWTFLVSPVTPVLWCTKLTVCIQANLKSGQVVSDYTLLPDVLRSLGWVRQTTTILLLFLL